MQGGIITDRRLNICECGGNPILIWHYISGIANRIHYYVKCDNCNTRIENRKRLTYAVAAWNNKNIKEN